MQLNKDKSKIYNLFSFNANDILFLCFIIVPKGPFTFKKLSPHSTVTFDGINKESILKLI
jgi:hypothetical protein